MKKFAFRKGVAPVAKTETPRDAFAIVHTQQTPKRRWGGAGAVAGSVNKYCESGHLSNEASVETLFIDRLISDLGYADHQIKFKNAIDKKNPRPHLRACFR